MYTKLDYCPTMPRPRQATRAAATSLDGLPDELIGDIPRPAAGGGRLVFARHPVIGVLWAGCGGVLLLFLFGVLVHYLGLTG